jgi:DHA2 family multidrug resistance protein
MSAGAVPTAAPEAFKASPRQAILTLSIVMASLMQSLDGTIANVILPHLQGSMNASLDQITWVITSYVVAVAICTPLTSFLATRFGRKRVFISAVGGFTLASVLCGSAQNLDQAVLFRIIQGASGAVLP